MCGTEKEKNRGNLIFEIFPRSLSCQLMQLLVSFNTCTNGVSNSKSSNTEVYHNTAYLKAQPQSQRLPK